MSSDDKKPRNNNSEYKAQSIRVIEGLEAVRKRPAMYIGSTSVTGLHHLVYEIVDNSIDEALAGFCDTIIVILHNDGSCSVEDNGRGIPTDIHPTEGVSATEVALTKLHAGGKFDKDVYKFSGGLHGVGVSVVNALSSSLHVTIWQNGKTHEQSYERGKPLAPLKATGTTDKRGTLVRFTPDPLIFQETTSFVFDTLAARLRELAFLNKGLRISIEDERFDKKLEFHFEGGIISFVQYINKKKTPLFNEVLYVSQEDNNHLFELALQYNDGYGEQILSYVNNINTVEGGTHVSGFRSALTKACNKKAQELGILKGDDFFMSEDVREGIVAVISMKVAEPQFEGQTKTKLGNSEVKGLVDSWTFAFLDTYFEENPAVARKILQKAEVARHAREAARKARDLARKKSVFESAILPGKLADCTSDDPVQAELFIVEGDSAGGSAKQGRDRANQAILPLRGKILNVEKARLDRILSNEEIRALIAAIGCGIGNELDATKARYHKIILMTDADVDGSHIRILLLTFFFRHMPIIIEKGYLYIAKPPLYKAKIGRKEQYLLDDRAFKDFLFDWAQEQISVAVGGSLYSRTQWISLLQHIRNYDALLERVSNDFKIGAEQAHRIAVALFENRWHREEPVDTLLALLRSLFSRYVVELTSEAEATSDQEAAGQATPAPVVLFKQLNLSWEIPLAFFDSTGIGELYAALEPLMQLEQVGWTLTITDKQKSQSDKGITKLITAIKDLSKPYMHVQRYKGLGEMNAEQLWETSMDSARRTLLKVTIQDALEADHWFSTLMGDDVSGRREYIERFGQFAKNIDV